MNYLIRVWEYQKRIKKTCFSISPKLERDSEFGLGIGLTLCKAILDCRISLHSVPLIY